MNAHIFSGNFTRANGNTAIKISSETAMTVNARRRFTRSAGKFDKNMSCSPITSRLIPLCGVTASSFSKNRRSVSVIACRRGQGGAASMQE